MCKDDALQQDLIHITNSIVSQHDVDRPPLQQGAAVFAGLNALEMMLLRTQLANNWAVAVETESFPEVQVAAVTVWHNGLQLLTLSSEMKTLGRWGSFLGGEYQYAVSFLAGKVSLSIFV